MVRDLRVSSLQSVYTINDSETETVLLQGRAYVADQFSIADSALFYVEFWAEDSNIQLTECCRAHFLRILKRPAVRV